MHNGYFYPQDIKVVVENGKRVASVDFELPTKWTEEAIKISQTCYLSGWEMARRAYEDEKNDEWLKRTHPRYYEEKLATKAAYKKGMRPEEIRRNYALETHDEWINRIMPEYASQKQEYT